MLRPWLTMGEFRELTQDVGDNLPIFVRDMITGAILVVTRADVASGHIILHTVPSRTPTVGGTCDPTR